MHAYEEIKLYFEEGPKHEFRFSALQVRVESRVRRGAGFSLTPETKISSSIFSQLTHRRSMGKTTYEMLI